MVISPGDGRPLHQLLRWLTLLGEAGAPGLLLREPSRPAEAIKAALDQATERFSFVALHERCGAIDDQRVQATHLKSSSSPRRSGPFGQSCHTKEDLDATFEAGAAYAFLSPVFPPSSKPDDSRSPLGLALYLRNATARPVLALGGVNAKRYRGIREQGGYGAAVLGDFAQLESVEEAKAKLARYGLNP
jgi:hypothetical protein